MKKDSPKKPHADESAVLLRFLMQSLALAELHCAYAKILLFAIECHVARLKSFISDEYRLDFVARIRICVYVCVENRISFYFKFKI